MVGIVDAVEMRMVVDVTKKGALRLPREWPIQVDVVESTKILFSKREHGYVIISRPSDPTSECHK